MAVPIYIGTNDASQTVPKIPADCVPGDLMLLFVENPDDSDITCSAGWTEPAWSPVANSGNARLTVFYRRYAAGDADPTIAGGSNHRFGVILAFRGCTLTGDPAHVTASGTEAGTSLTLPGLTTTVDNCLVVNAIARDNDAGGAHFSAWTNADLASITERQDQGTTAGNGGGTGVATGGKAAAGSVGGTTVTSANSANFAYLTIALAPGTQPFLHAIAGVAGSGGSITYNWQTGHQSGDIMLVIIETANEAVTAPAGWAHIDNSPQGTGTPGDVNASALSVIWKRATSSSESGATVSDPGDHQAGTILNVRRCVASGNPWDVTAGGVKSTASTSASIAGVTTTNADELVLYATTRDNDATGGHFSAWANATIDFGGVVEIVDGGTTNGNGGGLAVAAGMKQSAGATGTTTATISQSTVGGFICIALKAGAGAAVGRSWGYILG